MRRSIRTSLIATFLALSILPLIVVGVILTLQSFARERQQAFRLQHEVLNRATVQFNSFLQATDAELHGLTQGPGLQNLDPIRRQGLLQRALTTPLFAELALVNLQGQELARVTPSGAVPPSALRSIAQTDVFKFPTQSKETFFGTLHRDPVTDESLITVAIPTFKGGTQEIDGVLAAEVRLNDVLRQIADIRFGTTGTVAILDDSGLILAYRDPAVVKRAARIPIPVGDVIAPGIPGVQTVQAVQPVKIKFQTVYFLAELQQREAFGPAISAAGITLALILSSGLAAAALAFLAVRRIVQPIRSLATTAQAISGGALPEHIAITRDDEIGTLQRNFNQMVTNLSEQQATLSERNRTVETSLATQQQLFQTVAQLSTPLLPIWEGIIVVPIVGYVDAERGQALTESLLRGVTQLRAQIAILDITGLAQLDIDVQRGLLRAMRAVSMLGATPMLAGISVANADFMVEHDADLGSFATYRDLRSATAAALAQLATDRS